MLLAIACASDTGEHRDAGSDARLEADDELSIVPANLSVTALAGGNGVLEVTALTLRQGAHGAELYAALKNVGTQPACSAALSVELFDARGQSLAAGISGLLTQRFYRRTDGSHAIAACIAPSDVTMTVITELELERPIEDVASVVYRCPYFALEVEPIPGLTVDAVERIRHDGVLFYSGVLRNDLDLVVSNPSVTVFALNRVGRPFAVSTASGDVQIPPHDTWRFETDSGASEGSELIAYPAGALEN